MKLLLRRLKINHIHIMPLKFYIGADFVWESFLSWLREIRFQDRHHKNWWIFAKDWWKKYYHSTKNKEEHSESSYAGFLGWRNQNILEALFAATNKLNQIAKRVNQTGVIYKNDIDDIKKSIDDFSEEVWDIHSLLLKGKKWFIGYKNKVLLKFNSFKATM